MAGFRNHRDVVRAYNEGRVFHSTFRKNTVAIHQVNEWADLTRQPGNPSPFYYASTPMAFAAMAQSTHGGIAHGHPVAPAKKHIGRLRWLPASGPTCAGMLVDVLGYVPFVPEDDPGVDMPVDFTAAKPARWGTGEDVVMYLEIAAPHAALAGNSIVVNYTNSKGVAGRSTVPGMIQANLTTNGGLLLKSTGADAGIAGIGPFSVLQHGDTGIETVQSIRLNGVGDVGLGTLVFARVVTSFPSFGGGSGGLGWPIAWSEVEYGGRESPMMPVVDDDAFLSILFAIQNTTLVSIIGQADFIWSD